ncbi:M20 metallopeptidase family protein [Fundicoccus sp. Sow4_F4]|uniref:M20 metallopeptidase family protein n=1 Tax=Fundicoccus sp. Sow4_F4 TaxID=3438783 RepID=UPI003F91A875
MDIERIFKNIEETYAESQHIFRHLHQHPELSFQEVDTRAFIIEQLRDYGYQDIKQNVGGGGVITRLESGRPGPTIAFRADIDALAITEATNLSYQSVNPGVMHACGHDAHTTILLSAAKHLLTCRDQLTGTIVFIFQHAEEMHPGGARGIMESGELDDVDFIYGIHTKGDRPYDGTIECRPGFAMAASDSFTIKVQGKGGHAATPHLTVDSTVVAAFIIQQLQTLVSRHKNPMDSGVITIATFHSGQQVGNIIAHSAKMMGTMRTFNAKLRTQLKHRIQTMVDQICQAHGAQGEVEFSNGYPALFNHHEQTELIRQLFTNQLKNNRVIQTGPRMGGEDFAYYLQKIPGSFYYIRAGITNGRNFPHHHPKFQLDERCLIDGAKSIITIVNHYSAVKDSKEKEGKSHAKRLAK